MAIEEITISAPGEPDGPGGADQRSASNQAASDAMEPLDIRRLARNFLKAARARDRLVFTQRGRKRRQERFNQALKSIVKDMATEASREVRSRSGRLEVRTRVYTTMMVLAKAVAEDQLRMIGRSRSSLRWGVGLIILGLGCIVFTLVANGWLELPTQ